MNAQMEATRLALKALNRLLDDTDPVLEAEKALKAIEEVLENPGDVNQAGNIKELDNLIDSSLSRMGLVFMGRELERLLKERNT